MNKVTEMRYEHTVNIAVTAPMNGQVQLGSRYVTAVARRGSIAEGGRDGV